MSLNLESALMKPAPLVKPIVDHTILFEQLDRNHNFFNKIVDLNNVKRIFINAIYANDPVHIILVGEPGCGKTMFIQGVMEAFPLFSLFIDSTISSGIGMIEGIFDMAHRLRFLLVDEVEKFSMRDRKVLLNLLETGIVSRSLKKNRRLLTDMKVWLFATCNGLDQIKAEQPELLNRCLIINIKPLDYNTFEYIASIRLRREAGIDTEEIARYIAHKVYNEFNHKTNMRQCIRIARLAHSHAVSINSSVNKDIIDETVESIKASIL